MLARRMANKDMMTDEGRKEEVMKDPVSRKGCSFTGGKEEGESRKERGGKMRTKRAISIGLSHSKFWQERS